MTLTRRHFVQLIGASVAAVHLPKPVIAEGLPLLLGDGIHNDGPALTALFNRQPIEIGPLVKIGTAGWDGNKLTLPQGRFLLETPIHFADMGGVNFAGQTDGDKYLTRLIRGRNSPDIFYNRETIQRFEISHICLDHQDPEGVPLQASVDVYRDISWGPSSFVLETRCDTATQLIIALEQKRKTL